MTTERRDDPPASVRHRPPRAGRLAERDRPSARRMPRADLVAGLVLPALFVVAAVTGAVLWALGRPVHASAAPVFAQWWPHVGPGTPLAVAVAVLVWWRGPVLAARLRWRWLAPLAYGASMAWILSLALVDGWGTGVAGRLTTRFEYLHEVPGVTDIPAMLSGFAGRILDGGADPWTTHVAGHPPGALLVFVVLDRLGLGGGAWAGMLCVLAGAVVAVAVPLTVRLLGSDHAARVSVPFLVLFPGAVWMGVSADGLFAGVAAAGVALTAYAAGGSRPAAGAAAGSAGGALLGFAGYLSYGLVLLAPLAAVAILLGRHRWRAACTVTAGAAAVAVAFTAAGFWWPTGYDLVIQRYYQGLAADRPYAYWIWANLALLAVSAGPVAGVILRRAVRKHRRRAARFLPLAAAAAILAADLSGYSKAEVERIWLPFAVWLPAGVALLPGPRRRVWLAVQAAVALVVNHLLLTTW